MRIMLQFDVQHVSRVVRAVLRCVDVRVILDPPCNDRKEMILSFEHSDPNASIGSIHQALRDRTFVINFYILHPDDVAVLYPQEQRVLFHHVNISFCDPSAQLPAGITVGYPC